jgi:hypothetical protein
MLEEFEKKNRQRLYNMRAMLDYGMGIIVIGAGIFFLIRHRLDLALNEVYKPNWVDTLFGIACLFYGAWRIYRGYKKKYDA